MLRLGVEGHQRPIAAPGPFLHAGRHGPPNGYVLRAFPRVPVTADHPDDIGAVAVAAADPLAVDPGIFRVEDLGADAPAILEYLIAPGGQQGNVQPVRRSQAART